MRGLLTLIVAMACAVPAMADLKIECRNPACTCEDCQCEVCTCGQNKEAPVYRHKDSANRTRDIPLQPPQVQPQPQLHFTPYFEINPYRRYYVVPRYYAPAPRVYYPRYFAPVPHVHNRPHWYMERRGVLPWRVERWYRVD